MAVSNQKLLKNWLTAETVCGFLSDFMRVTVKVQNCDLPGRVFLVPHTPHPASAESKEGDFFLVYEYSGSDSKEARKTIARGSLDFSVITFLPIHEPEELRCTTSYLACLFRNMGWRVDGDL
jgi:hypothetical protein